MSKSVSQGFTDDDAIDMNGGTCTNHFFKEAKEFNTLLEKLVKDESRTDEDEDRMVAIVCIYVTE